MKILLYITSFSLILLSCSGSKQVTKTSTGSTNKTHLDEQTYLKMKSLFIDAQAQKNIGNFDQAMSLFNRVLEIDPNNDAALFDQAMILDRKGEYEYALKKVEEAAQINPSNKWYQSLRAQLYSVFGKYDISEKIYEDLISADPDNFDFSYDLVSTQMQMGNFDKSIETLNKIEERTGFNEDIILQKKSLYLELQKPELALAEIQKLIDSNPKEARYHSMLLSIYAYEKNDEKIKETIANIKAIDPDDPSIKLFAYDYNMSQGDKEKATESLPEIFESSEINIDTKMDILLNLYNEAANDASQINSAYELIDILTRVHPNEAKSHAISGDFLLMDDRIEDARNAFKKASELDPSRIAVWNQLITLDAQLNKPEWLIEDTEVALELYPLTPSFYYYNAIANSQEQNYEKAVESLLAGKELVYNDDNLKVEFYSALGNNYHELKQYKESDKYFDKALNINQNNAIVLNNYSYFLSIRNEKLNEAESMAKLANQLQPNSVSYMDTYAWVLYVGGKYEESNIWIKKAMANGGDSSGVIVEHYGDILFRIGEKDLAITQWNKAKELGDFSEFLLDKISQKKIIE